MQAWRDGERAAGQRVALVPTMGALHEGHLALVDVARGHADRVVVSIFVNPMQFNRRDDFDRYPRDRSTTTRAGARRPASTSSSRRAPAAMYPRGLPDRRRARASSPSRCAARRGPGHFRGVTTVVTKLFHAVRPHVAVFGEKDFQQLAVIRRMTADLDFGIEIVGRARRCARRTASRCPAATACSPADDRGRRACRAARARRRGGRGGRRRAAAPAVVGRAEAAIARPSRGRGSSTAELRDPETLAEDGRGRRAGAAGAGRVGRRRAADRQRGAAPAPPLSSRPARGRRNAPPVRTARIVERSDQEPPEAKRRPATQTQPVTMTRGDGDAVEDGVTDDGRADPADVVGDEAEHDPHRR